MHIQLQRSLPVVARFMSTNLNLFRKVDKASGILDWTTLPCTSRLIQSPPQKNFDINSCLTRPTGLKIPFQLPTCSGLPKNISSPVSVTINILDPMLKSLNHEKVDPSTLIAVDEPPSIPISKECVRKGYHMLIVRIRKMRKHKYRKLQKRIGRVVMKYKERRRKKRDVLFQAEMLAKVRAVDEFHAETHVKDVLRKVNERPKLTKQEMMMEMYEDLRRKNRSNVDVIPPKFDRSDV